MKFRLCLACALVMAAVSAAAGATPSSTRVERTEAAYLLGLGRTVASDELNREQTGTDVTVAGLASRFQQQLRDDVAAQRQVATRAFEDTFGRIPTDAEIATAGSGIYVELVGRNIEQLARQPDEYRQVIDRAYRLVVRRPAYDVEFAYWKERATLPYVLLVGCVEGWARRNAPGLMATTGNACLGVNSGLLHTLSISPAVAAELRTAFGLTPTENEALAIAAGRNVIAPGAGEVGSLDGMFIVVVGDHELVARH